MVAAILVCSAAAPGQTSASSRVPEREVTETRLQQLPEAPYVALSPGQKFTGFAKQLYAPPTFASAALGGGWGQMTGSPREYGGGMEGYGKRFGCSLAGGEAGRFFNQFLFPVILRQDPRYFAAPPETRMARRAQYAALRVLITRADTGRTQFNYSEVFGNLAGASLANTYYAPSQRTAGRTMIRFSSSFLTHALANLTREFWPDIRRRLPGQGTSRTGDQADVRKPIAVLPTNP